MRCRSFATQGHTRARALGSSASWTAQTLPRPYERCRCVGEGGCSQATRLTMPQNSGRRLRIFRTITRFLSVHAPEGPCILGVLILESNPLERSITSEEIANPKTSICHQLVSVRFFHVGKVYWQSAVQANKELMGRARCPCQGRQGRQRRGRKQEEQDRIGSHCQSFSFIYVL